MPYSNEFIITNIDILMVHQLDRMKPLIGHEHDPIEVMIDTLVSPNNAIRIPNTVTMNNYMNKKHLTYFTQLKPHLKLDLSQFWENL